MLKDDVVAYFGSKTKVATALGISRGSVTKWKEIIPERRAVRIERLSNGVLRYDPSVYEDLNNNSKDDQNNGKQD